jgi:hypothetical protein
LTHFAYQYLHQHFVIMALLNWVARLLVLACLSTGIAFNILVLKGCEILSVKNQDVYLGIFTLEVRGGGCIDYPEDQQTDLAVLPHAAENPFMRTAQAGCISGLCFGLLTLLLVLLDQLYCRVPGARCLTRYVAILGVAASPHTLHTLR